MGDRQCGVDEPGSSQFLDGSKALVLCLKKFDFNAYKFASRIRHPVPLFKYCKLVMI